ncbi:exocyst complex subunit Sec15-like-domain-containing protein [Phakopsora pachyrhizi]|nr:exocyst complex subunit Sec15-like-domain-containing protein [Phakopsora pachyrhizi]
MNQSSPKLTTPTTPNLVGKRKKTFFSHSDIESQLQNLSLYSDISSAGSGSNDHVGLHGLGPIIRNIHISKQQDAYLRYLKKFISQKESEIEAVCRKHYQDFIGSVDRLLSVRRGINSLRSQVITLDSSIQSNGSSLADSKVDLLEAKKVALNIDDTLETIQACLRVLSLSRKVKDQISNQRFYSALRSLDELEFLHLKPLLSFATFAQYLGEALPDERIRVREEVTRQLNGWLYEARESSRSLGRFAIEGIEIRSRRWKSRKDRIRRNDTASLALLVDINTPVEVAVSERYEYNPIDHPDCQIDFNPLYTAIHIYDTLESKEELQRSFKDDRRAQAHLILSSIPNPPLSLDFINGLIETIIGFFIIESHVLRTTMGFRNQSEVDSLWVEISDRVSKVMMDEVKTLEDLETLMDIKNSLLVFTQIIESYDYSVHQLNEVLLTIAKKCTRMLEEKFTNDFDQIVSEDDYQPMVVNDQDELSKVVEVSFLPESGSWSEKEISKQGFPCSLPFSQTYPLCCIDIRNFISQYFGFVEGLGSIYRGSDDVLRKRLDSLLTEKISNSIYKRVEKTRNLSQLSQILLNLMFFKNACVSVEDMLHQLKINPRAGDMRLDSLQSFQTTLKFAQDSIQTQINYKINDFFELASYDWTEESSSSSEDQQTVEEDPNIYLVECNNYLGTLMTNVLIVVPNDLQELVSIGAWSYISQRLWSFLIDPNPPEISDRGLMVLLTDAKFAGDQAKRIKNVELDESFGELVQTIQLLKSPDAGGYLDDYYRKLKYSLVKPQKVEFQQ